MTPVIKTQIYFPESDLKALRLAAKKAQRSVAELVREAVRRIWLQPEPEGPVALWDGEPKRRSEEHDSIYNLR
jgi:hypothetical protein